MKRKRILITGANGFIGKSLKEYLEREGSYEIIASTKENLNLLDARSVALFFKKNSIHIVLHCAVQGTLGRDISCKMTVVENNLRMFMNLERCKNAYGKMFYFGSGAEYGKDHAIPRMDEHYFDRYVPKDDYGFSKYVMSKIAENSENITNLRIFGVFGAYENYNYRFITNCICKMLKEQNVQIRQNVYFDYLYIDDLCKLMLWFLKGALQFKVYNVCSGTRIDLWRIATIVKEQLQSKAQIQIMQQGYNIEYTGDNGRLLREMGGFTFTSMEEAVRKLIGYYQNNPFVLAGDY